MGTCHVGGQSTRHSLVRCHGQEAVSQPTSVRAGRCDGDDGNRPGAGAGRAEAQSWPRLTIPGPVHDSGWGRGEKPNSYRDITTYNNFYEFGSEKDDPSANAHRLETKPWTVKVDGLVARPADYHLEDLIKPYALEERIYRMRCVERWSMVIPWVGFPLASLLNRIEPRSSAKFVEFTTLLNLRQMPGSAGTCWSGPMSRDCGSMRRCTRSRSLPSAFTATPAEPERRTAPAGGSLEVRIQRD